MNFLLRTTFTLALVFVLFLSAPALPQQQVVTPDNAFSLIRDAAQSLAAGNLDRAATELQSVLNANPKEFRALNLLGIVRAQQHREPEAEQLFKRAIEIRPEFASAHVSLGLLYLQLSKPDQAIPKFQEAFRLDPSRTDAKSLLLKTWCEQAHAAVQQNDPEKGLSILIQARKVAPADPDVLFDFGMIALRMSLFPDAVQAFEETLKVRKDDAHALYGLGRAEIALDKYENAQQTFAHYVELHPQDASGHYALGLALQALQRFAEARKEYDKSIELKPAQTESYFQLGMMDLDSGDLKSAADCFDRVLQQNPHHAGALMGMGRVALQRKEFSSAASSLQSAVAADSTLREAHYYLSLVLARLGRKEDSEKELEIASHQEKEDLEKHRTVFKLIDPEPMQTAPNDQQQ